MKEKYTKLNSDYGSYLVEPAAPKTELPKFYAYIFNETLPNSVNEIKGIIYTSGFKKGDEGYLVDSVSGSTTRLLVSHSESWPVNRAFDAEPKMEMNDYVHAEYIIGNEIIFVSFEKDCDTDSITIPPHELVNIS